ncbi:MAG: hypothetical protein HY898_33430 [Deltaproteobacteria bacterium]|nr:hypothetical protein [Deltaproteobacteria bacterium]
MPKLLRLVVLCVAWMCLLLDSAAHADLAPDPGWRRISYSFSIENTQAYGDYVFLAYPCSSSNGRPMFTVAVVTGAPVTVGSRGGMPRIYAVPKAEYEKSKESIAGDDVRTAAIKAIPGVLESSFRVQPMHGVGEDQPIDGAHDVLKVVKCDKTGLEVAPSKVRYHTLKGKTVELAYGSGGQRPSPAQALAKGTSPDSSAAASAPPAPTAPPNALDASPAPSNPPSSAVPTPSAIPTPAASTTGRGCGGCMMGGSEPGAGAVIFLASFACLLRRRGSRRWLDRVRG